MTRTWKGMAVTALGAIVLMAILAGPVGHRALAQKANPPGQNKGNPPPKSGQPAAKPQPKPQPAQEQGYWDKFKGIFVDWDDDAKPGQAKTQVSGVRGVNVETALGNKGYEWSAVKAMEDYQVSMDEVKQFLQEGRLGPYQGGE